MSNSSILLSSCTNVSISSIKIFSKSTSSKARSLVKTLANRCSGLYFPNCSTKLICATRRHSQTWDSRATNASGTSSVKRQTRECGEPVFLMECPNTKAPSTYSLDEPHLRHCKGCGPMIQPIDLQQLQKIITSASAQ